MPILTVEHSSLYLDLAVTQAVQSGNRKNWNLTYEDGDWFRIVDPISKKCLSPETENQLDDRDLVVLQDINNYARWQLWRYSPVPGKANWQYIVNNCERHRGRIKIMCLDVRNSVIDPGTEIIVYHVKGTNVQCPGNQWWH